MTQTKKLLPWPVMGGSNCLIATHWPPDVDGLACSSAWYHLAMAMQPSSCIALYTPTPIPTRLKWITEGVSLTNRLSDSEYDQCLILDSTPDTERTLLPEKWLTNMTERLWIVDHHKEKHGSRFPSVACAFIEQGLYHPLFFASIWSDSRRLVFEPGNALRYLAKLFADGLDNSEMDRQIRLLEPRRPEILFRDIVERTEVIISRQIDGLGIALVVSSVMPWRHDDTILEVREWLVHYADFVVVIDKERDQVSMWSSAGQDLSLGRIAASQLKGGGHPHMAGGSLCGMAPTEIGERILHQISRQLKER